MDFKNKVVWVTGASSGIGEALVKELAKQQAQVVLSARRQEELKRVQMEAGLSDESALVLPLDLADTSPVQSWLQQIIDKFGRIDVLINNGGISQRSKAMATPLELDRKFMEVNFFSAVNLTKAVIPQMEKQGGGHIVAIGSILSKFGLALHSTYAASKHATEGFFESLREELRNSPIGVTIISPGFINTSVSLNALTADGSRFNQMSEAQAKGMPADKCARKILKATSQKKKHKYVGSYELLMVPVYRFAPGMFYWLMNKMAKEE